MRTFRKMHDYGEFAGRVIRQSRYRLGAADEEFLKTVEETGLKRMVVLPGGTTLYRAQLKHAIESVESGIESVVFNHPLPVNPDRMVPLPNSAKEGRVNSKGIPCLYLADREHTAMAEVRPWLSARISLGLFTTQRDLNVMDCTADQHPPATSVPFLWLSNDPRLEDPVWGAISYAFSEPVTATDVTAEYAPTQILAEIFKKMGCDGIQYKSLLGPGGFSFALFDVNDAKLHTCWLHTCKNIHHDFSFSKTKYLVSDDGRNLQSIEPPIEDLKDLDCPPRLW